MNLYQKEYFESPSFHKDNEGADAIPCSQVWSCDECRRTEALSTSLRTPKDPISTTHIS
jgi:hypothetical protein